MDFIFFRYILAKIWAFSSTRRHVLCHASSDLTILFGLNVKTQFGGLDDPSIPKGDGTPSPLCPCKNRELGGSARAVQDAVQAQRYT